MVNILFNILENGCKEWPMKWTQAFIIPRNTIKCQTKLQNHQPYQPPMQSEVQRHPKPSQDHYQGTASRTSYRPDMTTAEQIFNVPSWQKNIFRITTTSLTLRRNLTMSGMKRCGMFCKKFNIEDEPEVIIRAPYKVFITLNTNECSSRVLPITWTVHLQHWQHQWPGSTGSGALTPSTLLPPIDWRCNSYEARTSHFPYGKIGNARKSILFSMSRPRKH